MKNQPVAAPDTAAQEEHDHVQKLASELRCLVCQNQTIADSTAGLAVDLRNTIREQLQAGKSDQAIREYMVERYGEFILYDPPFSAGNALLWAGPFLLALAGAWLAWRLIRQRENPAASQDAQPADPARLQALEERYRRETRESGRPPQQ